MEVQQQLRTSGRVQRGRIGVAIQEVTRGLAENFGLPRPEGALVNSVEPKGPAANAGVEQGDVIVRFAGKPVTASADLPRIVAANRPGMRVPMEVFRNGEPQELMVMVGEWQDDAAPKPRRNERAAPAPNKLGLVLALPSAAQRRERNVDHGLIVERVQGIAARAELQIGDFVLALVSGGRQVPLKSVDTFNRAVADLKDGQQVTLLVLRGDGNSYVTLRAGP
jgi:serine protease Do